VSKIMMIMWANMFVASNDSLQSWGNAFSSPTYYPPLLFRFFVFVPVFLFPHNFYLNIYFPHVVCLTPLLLILWILTINFAPWSFRSSSPRGSVSILLFSFYWSAGSGNGWERGTAGNVERVVGRYF
jgi:hypothetical protein